MLAPQSELTTFNLFPDVDFQKPKSRGLILLPRSESVTWGRSDTTIPPFQEPKANQQDQIANPTSLIFNVYTSRNQTSKTSRPHDYIFHTEAEITPSRLCTALIILVQWFDMGFFYNLFVPFDGSLFPLLMAPFFLLDDTGTPAT